MVAIICPDVKTAWLDYQICTIQLYLCRREWGLIEKLKLNEKHKWHMAVTSRFLASILLIAFHGHNVCM